MFILAIVFSGSLAWLTMGLSVLLGEGGATQAFYPNVYSFLGGLLFGLGAAANSGCGVSTVSRLARGELMMVATILGWVVSWVLFVPVIPTVEFAAFNIHLNQHYAALIIVSLIVLISVLFMSADAKKLWLTMLGIGVLGGVVFVYEQHWTPSGLLKAMSWSIWYEDNSHWPTSERFILIAMLLLGMFVAARVTGSFKLKMPTAVLMVKHLLAGILMGVGAVMAQGGNDTQLLVSMPALSPHGFTAVASIVLGIYVGVKVICMNKS
ncbi:YeeE/YedE thiosulfate transporter family protein [Vibrio fluminensis]|uniref:YeeE/YedE thiosulfate transporter family protein n=1 Tax=Vibrio fluminensis TaxID=2783614 RepID=UPI0018871A19|nr:YeeE/YedE thiosulfate transporter family protein [Vibrio fluminensis]